MPESAISRRSLAASAVALLTGVLVSPAGPVDTAVAAGAPVRITEGQVREAPRGGVILYPSVTSCLTVTVRLEGGAKVGAHASLFQVPGEYRSDEILPAVRRAAGGRRVRAVEVRGAVGAWYPGYFTKAVESYGPGEEVPYPTKPDPDGIADAVARGLGVPRACVTVEDLPDGDITVR
ncbi:hypothetical protein GCM10010218_07290 [Streptomyces mashuensis]|uniref:Uncharacterized protein n=1 Tax=Streptomyces mashuensis TaxID=33904 RepID=A0A919AY32_9ACTN|nr:hypothetical protein [Streptomyces mashuensis]GHF28690.1 hypothetical protein GCM10010218_07290 [Streptomyces mashuensis]